MLREVRMKSILDPCSAGRMMWFDRDHPDVVFGDRRRESVDWVDKSVGRPGRARTLRIDPDVLLDFRALPYPDNSFHLVAFDPPHVVRAGPRSWFTIKYGKLSVDWREDLRAGFGECFRVLRPHGTLVFKWNETQIPVSKIVELAPHGPLFGNRCGKKAGTHWIVFMKPESP